MRTGLKWRDITLSCLAIVAISLLPVKAGAQQICAPNGQCVFDYTVQPCLNNGGAACTVVGAYDQKQANYFYYTNGGQPSDGIPNTPFYLTVNNVYQGVWHTNNSNSPGLVVFVNSTGSQLSIFSGPNSNSGGRGYCNPAGQQSFNETANVAFGYGQPYYIYTIIVPYSCPN